MDLKKLSQFLDIRDFRNGFIGLFTVVGGLALAGLTVWSHRTGNVRLAGAAAAASLVFVLLILIFIVPPLARNASEEAAQMNLPFDFTMGGGFLIGLLSIVGFAAWNTGNNLLFLVLSFLLGTFVVSFLLGAACLRKIDVRMRFPETVFAGEMTPILVTLINRKRVFPTMSVVLEVRGTEREKSLVANEVAEILPRKIAERISRPSVIKHGLDYFMFVPRNGSIENRTEKMFPHRGRFIIKDFELSTRFPFGFFRHRRRLAASQAEIVIFPRPEPVDSELKGLTLEAGKNPSSRKGGGTDLLALREYSHADDLRRVDWKATARTGGLMVREFTAEDDNRVTVAVDSRVALPDGVKRKSVRERINAERSGKPVAPESERFEVGLGKAAGLLLHFHDEQSEVRLVIDDEAGEYGIGKEHLQTSLRRLALARPVLSEGEPNDSRLDLVALADEAERAHVFLVTAVDEKETPAGVKVIGY